MSCSLLFPAGKPLGITFEWNEEKNELKVSSITPDNNVVSLENNIADKTVSSIKTNKSSKLNVNKQNKTNPNNKSVSKNNEPTALIKTKTSLTTEDILAVVNGVSVAAMTFAEVVTLLRSAEEKVY